MSTIKPMHCTRPTLRLLALALALSSLPAIAHGPREQPLSVPPSGVIGTQEAYLSPTFWTARLTAPKQVLLSAAAIAARNTQLLHADPSMHDLTQLPATLSRSQVSGWITGLASTPSKPLWDDTGKLIPKQTLAAITDNRALDAIAASQSARFGLIVQRTAMRSFPSALRVFSRPDDTDIDRFQESALFPGTPVLIAHASADGQWRFVVSPRYAAWVRADAIAEGSRDAVLGYVQRTPYRVITGAKPRTVFTREQPPLSELQLDMGVRLPLANAPLDQPINGQHPYTSWILDLPIRDRSGMLAFAPALLPKIADSQPDYLPLTRANLILQAFKFLGERYGWGHSYNARDCSGFVSEIYRSMGVVLPRNTSAQAISPVFERIHFVDSDTRDKRMAAVAGLDVGDLIYIPGHVMMMIGRIDGQPYVIHDTNGGSYLGNDGKLRRLQLNGVSVTPLLPLRFDQAHDYIDRMTNIVKPTRAAHIPAKVAYAQ